MNTEPGQIVWVTISVNEDLKELVKTDEWVANQKVEFVYFNFINHCLSQIIFIRIKNNFDFCFKCGLDIAIIATDKQCLKGCC